MFESGTEYSVLEHKRIRAHIIPRKEKFIKSDKATENTKYREITLRKVSEQGVELVIILKIIFLTIRQH